MKYSYLDLAKLLLLIVKMDNEQNYAVRNSLVYEALTMTSRLNMACGIGIDPNEPEWPTIFINLPNGQISYHVPSYVGTWDKHSTPEKNLRILAFIASVSN